MCINTQTCTIRYKFYRANSLSILSRQPQDHLVIRDAQLELESVGSEHDHF